MSIRLAPAIFCFAFVVMVLGCTNQPTAPSRVAPLPTVDVASTSASSPGSHGTAASPSRFGQRPTGVIFVTSQGLYYDTFVVKDPIPMNGRFQLLTNGQTEFGPGQPGYLGGRWWEDLNGDGMQDQGDHYFLCPLLPPGRPTP